MIYHTHHSLQRTRDYLLRLLSLVAICLLPSCSSSSLKLRMLVLPIGSVQNTVSIYKPFVAYLRQSTGYDVDLIAPRNYTDFHTRLLGRQDYDIVNANGVMYSQIKNNGRYSVFAQETSDGEITYNSVIFASPSSGIHTLNDIRGKTIALVDKYSTSGSLYPVKELYSVNLRPYTDYNIVYLGSVSNVASAVSEGKVLAGATSWKTLKQLISSNQIKPSALRIIFVSSPIPLDPWLVKSSLPLNVQERIRSCFFDLSDRAILAKLGSDGFVPASSATHSILVDTDSIYKNLILDRQL